MRSGLSSLPKRTSTVTGTRSEQFMKKKNPKQTKQKCSRGAGDCFTEWLCVSNGIAEQENEAYSRTSRLVRSAGDKQEKHSEITAPQFNRLQSGGLQTHIHTHLRMKYASHCCMKSFCCTIDRLVSTNWTQLNMFDYSFITCIMH